jgi:hypothetical protein
MKKIIYANLDGSVSIVGPAPISDLRKMERFKDMTQAEYEAHVWERSVPSNAINPQWTDENKIPKDRYFRNAWKQSGKTVIVDMAKAKEVHMEKIRKARNAKLAKLDIETMKGNDVQKEKQALRDLPDTFDLTAKTPEELKALWPDELKEK